MRPPNFIGTTIDYGAPYISLHPRVPPVVLDAPTTAMENSRKLHIPAPLQPTKVAASHASQTAIDRLKELVARFR